MKVFGFVNGHMIEIDFAKSNFVHQLFVCVLALQSFFLTTFQGLMMIFFFLLTFFSKIIFLKLGMDLLQRYLFVNFSKQKNSKISNTFLLPSVISKICCSLLTLRQIMTIKTHLNFFHLSPQLKNYDRKIFSKRNYFLD